MPGGRFQAPAEEACLSCLEGSLSVSRRGSSEGWGQAASSLSATPGPEQPRPPSASEVSRGGGARGGRGPHVHVSVVWSPLPLENALPGCLLVRGALRCPLGPAAHTASRPVVGAPPGLS